LETGHVEMEGPAREILEDDKVQEVYLGMRV
jgi:ABC-type lipopolysaccharide export system ATPase subunit